MKKLFIIGIAAFLIIFFTACEVSKTAQRDAKETRIVSKLPDMAKSNVAYESNLSGEVKGFSKNAKESGLFDDNALFTGVNSDNLNDVLLQRKVIRNADLTLEVDDFYKAYGHIQSMINGIGFVQQTNIMKDYYYYKGKKKYRYRGNITIRVTSEQFDNILTGIGKLGDMIEQNISSQDITDQFFDTEGRLKVLKIELSYYEKLLEKAKDADEIFKIHTKLTQVRTQIERLEGTLNKWKNLVDLSTITIYLHEKMPDGLNNDKPQTYWQRLLESIKNSIAGVFGAFANLLIFVIEALPTLVVIALVWLLGYKIYKKRKSKKETSAS